MRFLDKWELGKKNLKKYKTLREWGRGWPRYVRAGQKAKGFVDGVPVWDESQLEKLYDFGPCYGDGEGPDSGFWWEYHHASMH